MHSNACARVRARTHTHTHTHIRPLWKECFEISETKISSKHPHCTGSKLNGLIQTSTKKCITHHQQKKMYFSSRKQIGKKKQSWMSYVAPSSVRTQFLVLLNFVHSRKFPHSHKPITHLFLWSFERNLCYCEWFQTSYVQVDHEIFFGQEL